MISAIFPAYNEEENVKELHERLIGALRAIGEPFEIIAVDNGSTDRTREELLKLSPIRIVSIAYNMGQSAGLDAGIHAAQGDLIVTLDADLQNDPHDILRMRAKLQEGYDAVVGWRESRRDSLDRKIASRLANWLAGAVLGFRVRDYGCALKIFKKKYLEGIRLYGEMHIYLAAILHLRGARVAQMPIAHRERNRGLTKYTVLKGLKNLTDLFTVKFLISTSRPLLVFGVMGLASEGVGITAVITAALLKIYDIRNLAQTPLPVIASFFIIVGLIFIMMGFLAELILRVYYEGRNATPYFIRDVVENK